MVTKLHRLHMPGGAAPWTGASGRRYRTGVTESASDQPKHDRNRNWRDWTVTKNRPIRIADELWLPFEAVCKAKRTDRSKKVRELIEREIAEFREANPGVLLPGDEGWADAHDE